MKLMSASHITLRPSLPDWKCKRIVILKFALYSLIIIVARSANNASQLAIANATLVSQPCWVLIYHFVNNCKHRTIRKILELKIRQQKFACFCKLL
jgi:hypothetical protein